MQNDGSWTIPVHDVLNDGTEELALVVIITNTISEGDIDGVSFALAYANVANVSCAREEIAKLVE